MECCGSEVLVFPIPVGDQCVALERCCRCDAQRWVRGTREVPREEAFVLLARAFREVPLRAHAARDRAHAASAARRASRLALHTPPARIVDVTSPLADELQRLLSGWQVLGAAS